MCDRRTTALLVTVGFWLGCQPGGGEPGDELLRGVLAAGELQIHTINVGQGSATLIVGPDGTTLLVDGGPSGAGHGAVGPYLQALGIDPATGLDHLVLTHRHSDHLQGLTELLEDGFDVTAGVWDNGSTRTNKSIVRFVDATQGTRAGPVRALPLGQVIDLGAGATATCVAVHGTVLGGQAVPGATGENDLSVALLVQHGDFDYLVAGDLGGGDDDRACTGRRHDAANVETPLASALTGGKEAPLSTEHGVEALTVNHHGSHGSTNVDYVNLLSPAVALVGVGANSYQHPRELVVESVLGARLPCVTAEAALVLQTDEGSTGASTAGHAVGDIVIATDGQQGYRVSASGLTAAGLDERKAAGLPLTVALDEPPPNQPPVADAGGPYSGPAGQPVMFDASGSTDDDGRIVAFRWQIEGQLHDGPTVEHTYASPGEYTVVLSLTDDDGASAEASALVTIGAADDSCHQRCGGRAPAGCWCDAQCAIYGDCCPDKAERCAAPTPSCAGHCGGQSPAGCWCDAQCVTFGDCCADKAERCDAPQQQQQS